jgi:hypothetical protein
VLLDNSAISRFSFMFSATSRTLYSVFLGYSGLFFFWFIFSENFLALDVAFLDSCSLFYSLLLSLADVTAANFNEMHIQLTFANVKQYFITTQLK